MERDSLDAVLSSTRLLLLFHTHCHDQQRLVSSTAALLTTVPPLSLLQVSLGQSWLQLRALLAPAVASDQRVLHCLQCLLVLCCDSLSHAPLQPLATPLRLIEEFAGPSNYPPEHEKRIITYIYGHLLRNGTHHFITSALHKL